MFIDEGTDVTALDIRLRPLDYLDPSSKHLKTAQVDITDSSSLHEAVGAEEADVFVHTAMSPLSGVFHGVFRTNDVGTENVLDEARKQDARFVYISSGTVYGQLEGKGPITESEPFKPIFPAREIDTPWAPVYCTTKRIGEELVSFYRNFYGMKTTTLRLGWVYGRGDTNTKAGVPLLLSRAMSGENLNLPYGGDTYCPLVNVADVASAIVKSASAPETKSPVYNVAYEKGYYMKEVAKEVERAVGGSSIKLGKGVWPSKGVEVPRGAISWPVERPLDISRAKAELRYAPAYDLARSVEETADWMRQHGGHA